MDFEKGGQEVIKRMLEAYGFSTRQALCNQLGVSKSTMATRFMRDIFPADWVIQCVMDTGVNIEWLASGTGVMFNNVINDVVKVSKIKLINGNQQPANHLFLDKVMMNSALAKPAIIDDGVNSYLVDLETEILSDGIWLIDIDGKSSIRKIQQLPGHKLRVSNEELTFDCKVDDVRFIAKVDTIFQKV
ncbi:MULTISPECIES: phage repressor protein CI [Yersinia]|uniref:phage repressor protein CI n=1 Tax=Yersinia TaxID=629 RepID=UPI0005DF4BA2|nr:MULTISPECIES: phage repressor protein CI [Yersinia]CQH24860.1 CI repressor [Yersinia pseudotuberculosis]